MTRLKRLKRSIASLLICLAIMPAIGYAAPKAKNPATIQDKIVKLGVGRWVCVDETNGLTLVGRITGIGDQSFGMQLHNYPEITDVRYADVVRVRNVGVTGKGALIMIGSFVGAGVAGGLILHHEYEVHKNDVPPGFPQP